MSIKLVIPSNHLILCHPLLLLPSIFPRIRIFSNESVLPIRWPKYWRFNTSILSKVLEFQKACHRKYLQACARRTSHAIPQHVCTTYILPHTSPPPSFRTMSYNIIEGDHWGSPYLLGIPCCAPASRTSFKHLGLFWFTFISVEKSVSSYIGSLHWHILCPLPGISPICTFSWRLLLSLQASAQELLEGEDEAFLIF